MTTSRRAARRRALTVAVTSGLVVSGAAITAAPAALAAPSADAVIAEVYGGGGNSGATLSNDFIELANRGAAAVSLDGFSVQYAPASGNSWQVTPLTGGVAPGARYLVSEAKGAGGTVALPTPDATGAIPLSATAGTIALVQGTTALTCKTAADCAADPRIKDLVGFGPAAVIREGAAAPAPSNTASVARGSALADTDDNAADFTSGAPTPTNSKGETPGETGPPPVTAKIHEIQGTTRISPFKDRKVAGVTGFVTAIRSFGSARGFWVTDPAPDADPRTSEGLFVFTGSTTPAVAVGDAVTATGTIREFYPDAPATSPYQSLTELTSAQWTVDSSGNALPAPTVVTPDSVPDAVAPAPGGSIEPLPLEPAKYSLDFWETHESEIVSVSDARVVGPTSSFNELYVTTKPKQNPSVRGGAVYLDYDRLNTGVLKVASLIPFAEVPFPKVNTGDVLTGETSGPVEYSNFGGYTLFATKLGATKDNGLKRESTRAQRSGELSVATYNVENLSALDSAEKFGELAKAIATNLAKPDILNLEEIQDNNGPANDGTVVADQTLQKFVDAIVAAGGPRYEWRQIDPENGKDGGQPGGNIRVGFLFNPARVSFVDRPGGTATTPVDVVKERGKTHLTVSPGRVDPANEAWEASRKPLVGEFVFQGRTVFVIANHFNSKGGDQPTHGRNQPPVRSSEVQRAKQATVLRGFIDKVLASDKNANIVVAGDLNDYPFSPAVKTLTAGGVLKDLIASLPENERYSYVFEGQSQVLDHILASKAPRGTDYDVVHLNAEFAQQASDHDPQVLRFRPSAGNPVQDAFYDLADYLEKVLGPYLPKP
ncbi:endonuclease/exonuclease/phosphatase family protein [Amycolatopsis sp. BJA-103]|uniref:endonuclease/exonuclease/phosphatase family protein n=1 Tax=Amycolatopsis sp. BJA-103 TaxID=1911175 RepID=UPI000C78DBEA|nr:endonuclease/exonuclease/phosphatase family protein [Amycolatopsis sp. BJA-103]AUI62306.1 endonuclease [Amycolatopsis sp. BJA-103]PNE20387.1 endonuclease [Amycolatopsis sp. BJA-103]